MARCCGEGRCFCVLEAGDNISIEGTGYADNPYVITGESGGGGGEDLPPAITWVRYDVDDGWPTRPTVPDGWAVMWINEVDDTPAPSGVGGAISGTDLQLLALPIP
jgi:hypothetical protein